MDAKVTGAIVTKESLGNLSPLNVTFFAKDVPSVTKTEGERVAILRFKTDKESGTKRQNMAVKTFIHDVDGFTSKSEYEFLQSLYDTYHDSVIVRCANGEITEDQATSRDWIVKDYFDTSRDSNGRKVSKETIAEWYNRTVKNTVEVRAITKNAQMAPETIARVAAGYCEMFQKFTKYDLVNLFNPNQLLMIQTLMTETTFAEDDSIAEYILGKLAKIVELKKEQDNLLDAI